MHEHKAKVIICAGLVVAARADGVVSEGRLRGDGAKPGAGARQGHQVALPLMPGGIPFVRHNHSMGLRVLFGRRVGLDCSLFVMPMIYVQGDLIIYPLSWCLCLSLLPGRRL